MVSLNRGLETKGDYIALFSRKTPAVTVGQAPVMRAVPADVEFDVDYSQVSGPTLPLRASDGYELKDETIHEATLLAPKAAKPLDNTDHMPSYRKKMIRVFVGRALNHVRH